MERFREMIKESGIVCTDYLEGENRRTGEGWSAPAHGDILVIGW